MNKIDISSQKIAKKKSHSFWRWFWLTFLVASLAYAWYSFYVPSNDIEWVSITSTKELANNSGKKTLIFFTGEWCVPCRIMKREVFANKEVTKIVNSQVIPVMIDIDNANAEEIVKHFKVGATPTTIVLDSKGKVLNYAVGRIGKKKFIEMLRPTEIK